MRDSDDDLIHRWISSAERHRGFFPATLACYLALGVFLNQLVHCWYINWGYREAGLATPFGIIETLQFGFLSSWLLFAFVFAWTYRMAPFVQRTVGRGKALETVISIPIFFLVPSIVSQIFCGTSTTKFGLDLGLFLSAVLIIWANSNRPDLRGMNNDQLRVVREDLKERFDTIEQIVMITLLGGFASIASLLWMSYPGIESYGRVALVIYFSIIYAYIIVAMFVGVMYVVYCEYSKATERLIGGLADPPV